MAAAFDGVDDVLYNPAAPVISTLLPLSMGCWFYVPVLPGAGQTIMAVSDANATAQHFVRFTLAGFGNRVPSIETIAGGSTNVRSVTGSISAGQWCYMVGRWIGASDRWVSALFADGAITHGQATVNRSLTGLDTVSFGGRRDSAGSSAFMSVQVAEAWVANVDVQPGGGQLSNDLMRQLAYGGPLSLPHIADNLVLYRSFRSAIAEDAMDEHSAPSPQTWNVEGVPLLAPHPPLPYWHEGPGSRAINLPI
jgi:hypothetical protein